ncbi:hypothetical protein M0R45_000752 [Rubus argutus]|uniref:Cyclic nucleotide-binding domain-containing protein n=1 Tax=Rubus argutus TaxID=59490 RepID=A0AAW1VP72_RUBAR
MSNSAEKATGKGSRDGNLSRKSRKKHGVHLPTSTARLLEETLNSHHKRKRMWNTFFVLACCVAVFVDPLFCYITVIYEDTDYKCITKDEYLMVAYVCLRPIVDVIYMIDIIISVMRIIRKKRKDIIDNPFRAFCCWRTRTVVRSPPPILHKLLPLLPRTLVALPILEIIIISTFLQRQDWKSLPKHDWNLMYIFYIIIPIQYTLRIYDIYASLRRRPVMKTGILQRWLKPILDFLPFILASHLFGALWYRLAIQRQQDCWKSNYKAFVDCEKPNISLSETFCPVREENSTTFNFGIYLYALQSNHNGTIPFVQRVSRSFWWALQNLSSFGSNLKTSTLTSEIYFSIMISISGLALFLVYLNARVQEAQESLKELKAKKEKKLMIPYVDLWLNKNVPEDMDKNEKMILKTMIMDNIHKLENNKVIDMESILSVLPFNDKTQIVYRFCKTSLRQVPQLENMNEYVLKRIAEHLKPVSYSRDNYIVEEGKPLGKMLFITQGIAWTYTTNGAGTVCHPKSLERGSFCGEELLDWAFKSPSPSDFPISTRTVISQKQVEAFALVASDLKSVVSKFWWYFRMKVTSVSQVEKDAASSIQAAWRRHHANKGMSRRPNLKFLCYGQKCF